jgi:hypothetical protein
MKYTHSIRVFFSPLLFAAARLISRIIPVVSSSLPVRTTASFPITTIFICIFSSIFFRFVVLVGIV